MALNGSPKQIAWAEKIRTQAQPGIDSLTEYAPLMKKVLEQGYTKDNMGTIGLTDAASFSTLADAIKDTATNIDDAAWWIDHQDTAALDAVDYAVNVHAPKIS